MAYYIWISINALLVISTFIYIWIFRTHDSQILTLGQAFAQIALILFIINVNMYFIFLVIRRTKVRKLKITLAKMSRYMMKSHIKLAIIGTMLIVFHGGIMLVKLGEIVGYASPKIISGMIAILCLALTMFAGYLRHKKSSGIRRKFHYTTAFIFTFVFLTHLFLPI
ncbi:hypothetical protein E1I69_13610 [Bacillus timonensis]|uniref:Ferric oxidoreductase domain-containing protein n=1 Tax=Bacillus timonensis TaxID=1033734 RepID=A0A4S3PQL0_9BACI|nr:hypothetical protein [Bacillus timonensis]THE11798.1 hypothetical protein E1I69_13610 [Bacillus timonensis]